MPLDNGIAPRLQFLKMIRELRCNCLARAGAVACLLIALGLPAVAAGKSRSVLVVYSNSRLLPANIEFDRGLRAAIPTSAEPPVELFDEHLDVPRFRGPEYDRVFAGYLRGKYASRPPDVIVTVSEEALRFILAQRADLFPRVPVIHLVVSRSFLRSLLPLPDDVVGVPLEFNVSGTIDQALRWRPQARRLVLVTGASAWDREWEARLRDETAAFKDRATAEFLAGLPTGEVLKRLGQLGGDAVVFTPGYFQDGAGRSFMPRESVAAMAAAAAAPVYGPYDTFLGTGAVGGYMPSFAALGGQAGESALALLDGAAPASLRLPEFAPTALNVDWRRLRRWGVDQKAIPAGAVLHFKEPTFLEHYLKETIAVAAVLLLQALLIVGLVVERHRRHRAEQALLAQRFELAHASRVAVAGELTAAIAHEINQPLGAILNNADAADLILESGGDQRDELRAILSDIRRDDLRASEIIRRLRTLLAKHEIERQPFGLLEAVGDVESMLRAEARRRGVTLDVRPGTTPVTVVGDRVQIQQVLINLLLNAMDAVAGLPEERRSVVVTVETANGAATVAVRDRGNGVAPDDLPKLFDSFFSTKRQGMGLGLSVARTLVEAHGGRIRVENAPDEGVVFVVELPVVGAGGVPSARAA